MIALLCFIWFRICKCPKTTKKINNNPSYHLLMLTNFMIVLCQCFILLPNWQGYAQCATYLINSSKNSVYLCILACLIINPLTLFKMKDDRQISAKVMCSYVESQKTILIPLHGFVLSVVLWELFQIWSYTSSINLIAYYMRTIIMCSV